MKISSNYLNKILSFLIILFLPAMITGPLIPEILMNVSILIFLILVFSEKKFYYFKNVYSYFFLLFYIYINIRSLFVDDLFFSLKSTLFYFRFYIFSLAIWFTMETNKNFLKKFVITLLSITIFLIIDGIIQYKFGANLLGWEKYHPTRVSSFFGDEKILGSFLANTSRCHHWEINKFVISLTVPPSIGVKSRHRAIESAAQSLNWRFIIVRVSWLAASSGANLRASRPASLLLVFYRASLSARPASLLLVFDSARPASLTHALAAA